MSTAKKTAEKLKQIEAELLKRVNAEALEKYKKDIAKLIEGRKGLYALYRKNKLYYLGRAGELKNKIQRHLKDHHQEKWTHFSLYMSQQADRVKELEAALLKAASKEGKEKLQAIEEMLPKLKGQVGKKIREEYDDLLESLIAATRKMKSKAKAKKKAKAKTKSKTRARAKTKAKPKKKAVKKTKKKAKVKAKAKTAKKTKKKAKAKVKTKIKKKPKTKVKTKPKTKAKKKVKKKVKRK